MSSLVTESFQGVPDGMNLALPAQELADTEARYLQDILVDYPGLARRRGPIRKVTGIASIANKGTGLLMALNPQGTDKYAVLNGDGSNGYFSVLSDDRTSVNANLTWPHVLPTSPPSSPYRIVDAKPALKGGLLVGVSSSYDSNSPNQALGFWMGANKADWTTSSITVARGSTAVTGVGFTANVSPGHWVFANTNDGYTGALLGYVKSVNSDTSLTLGAVSPYPVTAHSATFQALRGVAPKVVTGRITADTTGTQVTGGATKFISQGLGTGSWNIYRASDLAWVGKVASVQSSFALTLSANAAIAMAEDAYVALRADSDYTLPISASDAGWLNATYAGRQWYASNGTSQPTLMRLWFSDPFDPEALDLSTFDGDWDDISNTAGTNESIRAILATNDGLAIWKENETWLMTGSSPNTFSPRKILDDGTLSGMSVQAWGGGAVWAGRDGIYIFDGVNTTNITSDPVRPKLGDYWKNTMATFDPTKYRMWSFLERDHYALHIENVAPTVAVVKGNVSSSLTRLTVLVNLATGAITFQTNLNARGAVTLPASANKSVWYLVNGKVSGDASDHAFIADAAALFNEEGVDPVTCDGGKAGPDFFFESKKYDAGDPTRLKKFKLMILEYLVQGGNINVDVALGLNNIAKTLTGNFASSVMSWDDLRANVSTWDALKAQYPTWNDVVQSVFKPKRVKFQKGSQFLSFRLYQSSSTITRLQVGPFGIGYKLKRPGRV